MDAYLSKVPLYSIEQSKVNEVNGRVIALSKQLANWYDKPEGQLSCHFARQLALLSTVALLESAFNSYDTARHPIHRYPKLMSSD